MSPCSYWINNFGSDFKLNPEVRMQLLEFQNEVQIDIGNKAARLLDLEIWWVLLCLLHTIDIFVLYRCICAGAEVLSTIFFFSTIVFCEVLKNRGRTT